MRRRLLVALAAAASLLGLVAVPSDAFFLSYRPYQTNGRMYYSVDESFWNAGFLETSLWTAEQTWKQQGLGAMFEFWNTNTAPGAINRRVYAGYVDGPGGATATATLTCDGSCMMKFEPQHSLWNTTQEIRDDSWLDFVGVATHEFGHWIGLEHTPRTVSSDGHAIPTMNVYGPGNRKYMRSIQSDDVNGFRAARHGTTSTTTASNIAANGSFEFTPVSFSGSHGVGWTYRRAGAAGSSARYCGGSIDGSCFIEFNGGGTAGSSLFQDIDLNDAWYLSDLTPRAQLRSPVFTSSATVAAWALEPVPTLIWSRTCTLPAGQWVQMASSVYCTGPFSFAEPGVTMRLEIYNNHPNHNLDVDDVRLEARLEN